ncbi:uroporphyrinogen decarboxylase [Parachlamydia sp. AcF125]|uniref:uroporphyrinogen decarboxylase n=1 Tax=Parachlamydia sp. AcF125 TaxID=2795736 RepID=UPI001BCA40D1|nr:uroporphyrinogen decarboxylase [Parachlamydia sp. AcF125]MBS4168192.1 Uroporphyrinogen decarboxylase [Parachlamydia sp. AcF125]
MYNSLLLDALNCKNQNRPPVWLMRQAGRYMPQYRTMREKYSFLEMCHQPELAAEVTLMPIKTFGMDAAILFSDILVIPEALEVGLRFEETKGPIIERPLNTLNDIHNLPDVHIPEALDYVSQAIKTVLPHLKVPLIGFSGAPFTLASYLIEGRASQNLKKTKQWMLREPSSFHQLLNRLANLTIEYLLLQIEAGVKAIQIFDSWAHVLSYRHFQEFSLHYLKKILEGLASATIPIILFCRGSSVFASSLASLKPAAISLDWNSDLKTVRQTLPSMIALQGNLDPDILYASPHAIRQQVSQMLKGMQRDPGYIFNLGHGIHPDTPMESVYALVECVQNGK